MVRNDRHADHVDVFGRSARAATESYDELQAGFNINVEIRREEDWVRFEALEVTTV